MIFRGTFAKLPASILDDVAIYRGFTTGSEYSILAFPIQQGMAGVILEASVFVLQMPSSEGDIWGCTSGGMC
jgi:hypothetical protein